MKILHVLFSFDAGGMENGVANVSRALPPEEFEMHACCLARGGAFAGRFPRPEHVHILGKKEGFSPSTIMALARHIRAVAPDIIHTHNLGPLIYTALAAPAAPILHGEHAELTPAELTPRRRLIRRLAYTRARRVHTVSDSLRASLIGQGFSAAKIDVIVNGVDTKRFQPGPKEEARRETGLPPGATLLGLVGRFGAFKRHAELIQAFDRLAPSRPGLALVFAGTGGPREQSVRERAAASPYASRIHFAGFQQEPAPWYRALDLLVIPSVNEGLSNALLEAMACGIPVLAHTACGSKDVLEDSANGFLRDLLAPEALAEALIEALRLPARLPALGLAARRTVESGFSFGSMLEGYRRLYRQIASGNR